MVYLVLDTNQWIYLANGKDPISGNFQDGNHFKLLNSLVTLVEDQEVQLLTNPIIVVEWVRNKQHINELVAKLERARDSEIISLTAISNRISGNISAEAATMIAGVTAHYNALIQQNNEHIAKVQKLLDESMSYPISKDVKAEVTEWAIEKKAPFIGDKKNSSADAAILFGAIEFKRKKRDEEFLDFTGIAFVSANKNDFAAPNNPDIIHPDLTERLSSVEMTYFKGLPFVINSINEAILKEEEMQQIQRDMEELGKLENTIPCISCYPDEENFYTNLVSFNIKTEIVQEDYDENQMELQLDIPQGSPHKVHVEIGYCTACGETHIKCECGEIMTTEGMGDGETLECEGCGLIYKTYYDHDGNGHFDERIVLAAIGEENG